MNNDGWGFMGAGASDKRLAGEDLQHNIQHVKPLYNSGGPVKEMLNNEATRHQQAGTHRSAHIKRHQDRNYNSQYGHDTHKY